MQKDEETESEDLKAALFFPDPIADPLRESPFLQAAFKGHLDVIQYVVRCYPAPKYVDYAGTVQFDTSSPIHHCTALTAAVLGGHTDAARVLLEAGASTEIRDCTGATPLCEAVFHNRQDIVCLLREGYGADVNTTNAFGWTPLHIAVDRGHLELTDYLLAKGADVSLTTPEGYTVLHVAAMKGRASIVNKLLQQGCVVVPPSPSPESWPDKEDKDRYAALSPLYLAAYFHHNGVLQQFKLDEQPASIKHNVESLKSARSLGENDSIEKHLDSVRILERCMGPRDPLMFWELTRTAAQLWHKIRVFQLGVQVVEEAQVAPGFDAGTVWTAVQEILTKAVQQYEQNQLLFLRQGYLLPQNVAEEVGRWGIENLVLLSLKRCDGSTTYPDFGRFTEFLLNVLNDVRERSRALRDQFGCEEELPQILLSALFRCFHSSLSLINHPLPHTTIERQRAEQVRCHELGKKFVSLSLHLPQKETVLWALLKTWRDYFANLVPPTAFLLEAVLDWGATKVINVTYTTPAPPQGDTLLHQLCRTVSSCSTNAHLFARLIPLLVSRGAHVDMVNSIGETAYAILSSNPQQQVACGLSSEELAMLQPPIPPSLYCLVSHKLVEWDVAGLPKLEELLPRTVIRYVRFHNKFRATVSPVFPGPTS